jgi:DNA-binding NtrC family response regulator
VPGRASSDVPDRPDPVGAKVVDARSTEIALRRLADTDVDLMVTDIEPLSGADGLELTATVRKRYPVLPVVVLSGHATFDHAVVAMREGASEFLPKPADPERLTTAATALLEQRRRRVATEACHRSRSTAWVHGAELVEATARHRGRYGRIRHAEPLEVVRDVARPVVEADPNARANGLTVSR